MKKSDVFLAVVLLVVVLAAQSMLAQALPGPSSNHPLSSAAQSAADSPASSPVSVQQDVPYGDAGGHPLLLDIYDPGDASPGLRPAVVLIHGGGWISFDKSTMHSMGMFLARGGFVAFSVDYRLMHGTDNLWPAQLDDVQRAVRWIRANAEKYRVDPDHIGAFGHSAGAQLAALLGMLDTREKSMRDDPDAALAKYSSRVQAVVDVSGPSDFTTNHDPDSDAFLTAFLGGSYAQRPEAWRDASPAFHASKKDAPFLIVHGTQDEDVPLAQAQELADKLKLAGVAVKFVTVEDVHTFHTPEARRRLALESQVFFDEYLRPGKLR